MTKTLQRITTQYVETEDRLRLCGEDGDGVPMVIWVTQRLLKRLLPPLLRWLEARDGGSGHADLLRAFAQQAARAEQQPQAPVRAADGSVAWIAHAVDIATAPDTLGLTFRSADGASAVLLMEPKLLRQWLGILYEADRKAEWALAVWPAWLRESAQPTAAGSAAILH